MISIYVLAGKALKPIKVLLVLILFVAQSFAQVKLCSWNIQNFGKSKPDSAVAYMAEKLRDFDVVAIVEVVAGNGGAQAVARLADELNRKGSKWDYSVSDPTFSTPARSERYAFLWKTSVVKKNRPAWLEQHYKTEIEREPYCATFVKEGKSFTVMMLHALPKKQQPEKEIKYLKFMKELYPQENLLFCGDFNCPQSHTVFAPLKAQGYLPALTGTRTTLKTQCQNGDCLASEYDNIFYDRSKTEYVNAGALPFYKDFTDVKQARRISDHLPVFLEFRLR